MLKNVFKMKFYHNWQKFYAENEFLEKLCAIFIYYEVEIADLGEFSLEIIFILPWNWF